MRTTAWASTAEALSYIVAGVAAFLITTVLIPLAIRTGECTGLLDVPGDARRIHRRPIPRVGGIAIVVGTLAGMVAACIVHATLTRAPFDWGIDASIGLGTLTVFALGLADDAWGASPPIKICVQVIAAGIVLAGGFQVDTIAFAGAQSLELGWLAKPLCLVWLIAITNAFNLIDGLDGLAGAFAVLSLCAVGIVGLMLHHNAALLPTLCALGATLAFLRFNWHPARVFLGDAGSMSLGFFLACMTIPASTAPDGRTFVLIPVFALAFALTDTAIAIARRWLRGHPISRADSRHIHHQLLALGLSAPRVVETLVVFYGTVLLLGISVALAPPNVMVALALLGLVIGFIAVVYGVRRLGYTEFIEFAVSVGVVLRSARGIVREKILAHDLAMQIDRATSIEAIHELLDEYAPILGLVQIELIVDRASGTAESRVVTSLMTAPFYLEYTIGRPNRTARGNPALRIWCGSPIPGFAAGSAERVALRLAPMLERWMAREVASRDAEVVPLVHTVN